MPAIKVYSMRPYHNIDGFFTDIPEQPTFDPLHPTTYPGNEVVPVETITGVEAVERYGKTLDGVLYTVPRSSSKLDRMRITIWEKTGKTSADIVAESRQMIKSIDDYIKQQCFDNNNRRLRNDNGDCEIVNKLIFEKVSDITQLFINNLYAKQAFKYHIYRQLQK